MFYIIRLTELILGRDQSALEYGNRRPEAEAMVYSQRTEIKYPWNHGYQSGFHQYISKILGLECQRRYDPGSLRKRY